MGLLLRWRFLRVALLPQRAQAMHVLDGRLVPGLLLPQCLVDLGFPPLVLIESGFGYFAIFCAHQVLPVGDANITRWVPKGSRVWGPLVAAARLETPRWRLSRPPRVPVVMLCRETGGREAG